MRLNCLRTETKLHDKSTILGERIQIEDRIFWLYSIAIEDLFQKKKDLILRNKFIRFP